MVKLLMQFNKTLTYKRKSQLQEKSITIQFLVGTKISLYGQLRKSLLQDKDIQQEFLSLLHKKQNKKQEKYSSKIIKNLGWVMPIPLFLKGVLL